MPEALWNAPICLAQRARSKVGPAKMRDCEPRKAVPLAHRKRRNDRSVTTAYSMWLRELRKWVIG